MNDTRTSAVRYSDDIQPTSRLTYLLPSHDPDAPANASLARALVHAEAAMLPGEIGGHSVYRIAFEDGSAYVGTTGRSVLERIEEHFGLAADGTALPVRSFQEKLELAVGTFRIIERLAAGVPHVVDVLHSGLSRSQAHAVEAQEIANLSAALNTTHATSAAPSIHDPRAALKYLE